MRLAPIRDQKWRQQNPRFTDAERSMGPKKNFGADLGLERNPISRANEIDRQKNSSKENQDGWLAPKIGARNETPCSALVKAHTRCKTDFLIDIKQNYNWFTEVIVFYPSFDWN
jgi:hypothetical protein